MPTMKEWLGIAAVTLGLGTTIYNLGSKYLDGVRQHAIEDKQRNEDLLDLSNRVDALEQLDYKIHPTEWMTIYYANGERERVKVRRQ